MTSIAISPTTAAERQRLPALFNHIVDYDQFDDWLPDCVYLLDYARTSSQFLSRVDSAMRSERLAAEEPVRLALPRRGGKSVPAVALALRERLCAHLVIAANGAALEQLLLRDKVYGFRFVPERQPIFAPPGEGLAEMLQSATFATAADRCTNLQIWDIDQFSVAAKAERISEIFLAAGASVPSAKFVISLLGSSSTGLPSCDDAYAFVFNCYLHPVDSNLLRRGVNFFRYRDEYVLLRDEDRPALAAVLAEQRMTARMRHQIGSCAVLRQPQNEYSENDAPVYFENDDGRVVGQFAACLNDQSEPVSDCWELSGFEGSVAGALLSEPLDASRHEALVDAFSLAPTLRRLNLARRKCVQLLPPFVVSSREGQALTAELTPLRPRLTAALQAAITHSSTWQCTWSSMLLSDCPSLESSDREVLRSASRDARLSSEARWGALSALARHGDGAEEALWAAPAASHHAQRCALLAASYLARHSKNGPWLALRPRFGSTHSDLVALLDSWSA